MKNVSRRSFLGGLGALAAVGAAGLAGCSPTPAKKESAAGDAAGADSPAAPVTVDESIDCDIVIVGAGCSGLAACVQAADAGKKVVCVEANSQSGGGAGGVEGVFGVGSHMQQDQGIDVSVGELVRTELVQNQYRNSSLVLKDLIRRSGEDIDWLADHGVQFGTVDNYVGFHPIFHWFKTLNGKESYIPQMTSAAEKGGVEFRFNTHADTLIVDESGTVKGLYAASDGKTLQVNANAVILATGGFAENDEMLEKAGFHMDFTNGGGMYGDGSGNAMATAIGAASNVSNAGFLGTVGVVGLPAFYEGGYFCSVMNAIADLHSLVWVNDRGERVVNEDLTYDNHMISVNLGKTQDAIFFLLDEKKMTDYINNDPQGLKELEDGLKDDIIIKGSSWSELSAALGMDATALDSTITEYNKYCADGVDEEFAKASEYLVPFATEGTVYAIRTKATPSKSVGSVKTNRDFCVVNEERAAIPGLYAIGTEGAMIWADVYTMNLSGSCAAHNVYSGRMAVQHALENCM